MQTDTSETDRQHITTIAELCSEITTFGKRCTEFSKIELILQVRSDGENYAGNSNYNRLMFY